jgi:NAD(P)-dependent dehydrogenase (short-subunit alcohol dehydrogenase family)
MNGWAAPLISQEVADKVGKCWGLGSDTPKDPGPWEGELRNMWKPTQQEALWFHGGNLHQSRHYSQFLSLQLKARMEGIRGDNCPVYGPRRFGRIINVASIAGKVGFPDLSHYSASKFAVIGFTNAVAKEVATEGVTVNALCPGIVGTGMWRGDEGLSGRWRQEGESEEASWERHQKTLLPQGVAQTPEDMGQLAVYLASAAHVTGQAIAVDGGFSL